MGARGVVSFHDAGTGAHQDITIFRPDNEAVTGNCYSVGHIAVKDHVSKVRSMDAHFLEHAASMICSDSPDDFAVPTGWMKMWSDRGTGRSHTLDGGFFTAHCPLGYYSVGDIGSFISNDSDEPNAADSDRYRCVSASVMRQLGLDFTPLNFNNFYRDYCSGAKCDCTIKAN